MANADAVRGGESSKFGGGRGGRGAAGFGRVGREGGGGLRVGRGGAFRLGGASHPFPPPPPPPPPPPSAAPADAAPPILEVPLSTVRSAETAIGCCEAPKPPDDECDDGTAGVGRATLEGGSDRVGTGGGGREEGTEGGAEGGGVSSHESSRASRPLLLLLLLLLSKRRESVGAKRSGKRG